MHLPLIKSAARSPNMIIGAFVLPDTMSGITLPSTTLKPAENSASVTMNYKVKLVFCGTNILFTLIAPI